MTQPQHHPHDDLLISHATCHEHPAVGLLVSTHATLCEECRRAVADLETIGAMLFEQDGEMPVTEGAKERMLRAALAPYQSPRIASASARASIAASPEGVLATVDYVLAVRDAPGTGRWHWRAPGVTEVRLPLEWNGIPVTVARLRSGLHIPRHTHDGRELTLVLSGSLSDAHATYRAGDVADYDQSISHEQFVDGPEDCLCLVVNQSRLVPQTMLGRALAWMTGA